MYVSKILDTISLLKKNHPKVNIGKHIATALDGHDVWSITDKKFYELLSDYQAQLDAVEVVWKLLSFHWNVYGGIPPETIADAEPLLAP